MNYTENFAGIKLDVQAVDITITDDLQQAIRDTITKLKRHVSDINWVDVYLNADHKHATDTRNIGMRLGIPGTDVYASDSGEHWLPILKSIEEKLRKQLEKR
jgi:ribosomal subunit interface protein